MNAAELRAAAERAEPAITAAVVAAAARCRLPVVGLEDRLKTVASIEEKIVRRRGATDLEDLVRYTVLAHDDEYVDANQAVLDALEHEDCSILEQVPGWRPGGQYKGLNHVLAYGGQAFELQVHTPASHAALKAARRLYEERRRPGTTNRRQRELRQEESELFAQVPWPPGIPSVP